MPLSASIPSRFFSPDEALNTITADGLLRHIEVLASDEFEGRAPGSRGEDLTVRYLIDQFEILGLKPGHPDGTYVQEVPLMGITASPKLHFQIGEERFDLNFPDDFVASTARLVPEVRVEASEIIFVGYGVVAPEYGWDDYKDVDVRGKTILMLINDPAVPDPSDPSKLDETLFKGSAMTYYGRWTYKYEIAARRGAAAAMIIHETGPAAYPYTVVQTSWAREVYEIDAPDQNLGAVPVRSWVSEQTARRFLNRCGQDFDDLKGLAVRRDFRPVALGATANCTVRSQLRSVRSRNVLARLEGSDPACKNERIIYTAHWDHLGKVETAAGEPKIYRGALDNASGVAALLELAKAYLALESPPRRSILFMAPTAEESVLLGARFYTTHPLYPLDETLANLNIDTVNPWGRTRDLENVTHGLSTLDDLLAAAARKQGRTVVPNTLPEKGMLYRADHFEFARKGIPCLYTMGGKDVINQPSDFGQRKIVEYISQHYHQPSDQIDPHWDLTGAAEDVQLLFEVGYQIANGDQRPVWKPGTEFYERVTR